MIRSRHAANPPTTVERTDRVAPAITTYREGALHAALKERYARLRGGQVERVVDGFVVDVVAPGELIEIQTGGFAGARRKLERLVEGHRVALVHPVPAEKWLIVVDGGGAIVRQRRSPRRGQPLDLFDELVHLPALVAHRNFRVELLLTTEEEVRGPLPAGVRSRYPRAWRRLDRRLVGILETRRIDRPSDLLGLLPDGLPPAFTTADIVAASGRSKRLAMRAVYCLERCAVIERDGRRGRHAAYRRRSG